MSRSSPTVSDGESTPGFLELLAGWDGLGVVVRHDEPTGSWIFVALHDDTLGRPVGGCRMKVYPRPEDGLLDAMRLAEGMTHKWAALDLPFGGGKAVLAVPRPLEGGERKGLLHRFGALLTTLQGAYGTGEDLGTTPEDMKEIASVTEHVVGLPRGGDGPVDPGPFTALGVLEGMKAALKHRTGSAELKGRSVLVQGAGDVGDPLARMIDEEGGRVLVSDLNEARAAFLAEELGGDVVDADEVYRTPCDVYAPCAVGATLNPGTIPDLRCSVVAGSANNQLATERDAGRLRNRGILYAPDYVINAGGALAFGLIYRGETNLEEVRRRVRGIGEALDAIFAEAGETGESPLAVARRRVDRVLARGRV